MDDAHFDALTRAVIRHGASRRRVLRALAGAALGALLGDRARQDGTAQTACGLVGATCAVNDDCCAGAVCNANRRCACRTGFSACPVAGGSRCFNLQTNRNHCGDCATACAAGEVCSRGKCCRSGLTNCGGVCRNLRTDNGNCGACGTECFLSGSRFCACGMCVFCPLGGRLSQTTCRCDCPAGQTNCGGVCRDLRSDRFNCGACGRTCPTGQACCGGACTVLTTDEANCGACGTRCQPGRFCCGGRCTPLGTATDCRFCGDRCPANDVCAFGGCCTPALNACDPAADRCCGSSACTATSNGRRVCCLARGGFCRDDPANLCCSRTCDANGQCT